MTPLEAVDRFYQAPPARLGVAVSGGSDSLGLLIALHRWGRSRLFPVTVDHRLRPTSAGEALHVARIAEKLGLSHATLEWTAWDGRGNLQDQARRTRYSMLADWGRAEGLDAIALGHTMDDQAETFLMRLARQSGLDGLAAMSARFQRHGMTFHRPLLSTRRGDLRDLLAETGVTWVEDPSNDDDTFDRVRIRRVLADLETAGLGADRIAASARHLDEARAALAETAAAFARAHVTCAAGDLVFPRTELRRLPRDLARRLVAAGLRFVATADYPPRGEALDDLLSGALAEETNATLHGCRVLVSAMTVRITREHAAVARLEAPTNTLWDARWSLDGPHAPDLRIAALGEAVAEVPGWRDTKLPRATLLASPAVWRGDTLVAAPVAGHACGWRASAPGCDDFTAFLLSH